MTDRISILQDRESPPGGWVYTVPETGLLIKALYAKQAKSRIMEHMAANSIPIPPDYDEWIEDILCRENGHGPRWCGRPPAKAVAGTAKFLTLAKASRFVRTMLHVIRDRKLVSESEAMRRAAICMKCPLSGDIAGCRGGCHALFKTLKKLMPDNTVEAFVLNWEREHGLEKGAKEFALCCGCFIHLKAWIPNETLDKAEEVEAERPDYAAGKNCWRLEER